MHLQQLHLTDWRNTILSKSEFPGSCSLIRNLNIACICKESIQAFLWKIAKAQMVLCSNFSSKAGTHKPVPSPVLCYLYHSQEHSSHLSMCLDLCSLCTSLHSPKQADESLVTPCLPNFKSHTYLPIRKFSNSPWKQRGEMAADLKKIK